MEENHYHVIRVLHKVEDNKLICQWRQAAYEKLGLKCSNYESNEESSFNTIYLTQHAEFTYFILIL